MKKIDKKTTSMKYIELTFKEEIETLLHKLYIEEGKNVRQVALTLGVHYNTVNSWLKLAGIQLRLPHEQLLHLVEIKRRLKENV